jgi:ferredoxin
MLYTLLLLPVMASVFAAAPLTPVQRAHKLCTSGEKAEYLQEAGSGVLVFCKDCVESCPEKAATLPAPTSVDCAEEQITSLLFQSKPGAEEIDVLREHPIERMRLTSPGGLQTSHQITMKSSSALSMGDLIVGKMLGGAQEFKTIPLVEYSIRCDGAKCIYSDPLCRLDLRDVAFEADRQRARAMQAWQDDTKDTLYLIDRVALMAAAGDEEMYVLLAGKFRLMGTDTSHQATLDAFQNATVASLARVETLRELGCAKITTSKASDAAWTLYKEKLAVLSPYREGAHFAGFEIKQTVKGDFFDRNGLKVGDVIRGTDKVPYTDVARSADALRWLPRLYSTPVTLNILRGKQAKQMQISEGLGMFGKESLSNQLWGQVPFILAFKASN